MNERIEYCLYQAGLTAQGCWEDLDTYTQEGIEKFSELIIRECIDVVGKATTSPNGYQALMKHFGVEE
jgi:hypothetical protein